MLYLPPHLAHEGIALDAGCQTWSVGFRAQSYKEMLQEGLWRLAESLEDIPELEQRFGDPKQQATSSAEHLPEELIKQIAQKLQGLKLDQVETFLPGIAAYLSEPKPQAYFDGAMNTQSPQEFKHLLEKQELTPHPQTRLIAFGKTIYCNGENMTAGQAASTVRAWQLIAAQKRVIATIDKIEPDNSLFGALKAGWLNF
jgi:50S ribosomal protein L16 3-hydroxylase